LNACRVLAYLREGRMCSKEEGGVWAIQALPDEFKTLVARALDTYRGDCLGGQFDTAGLPAFAAYLDECMMTAQG
jgi:streptomycin 3"-adenylyltransferase